MAMYGPAVSRLLPETTTQPRMRATQIILHVSAGESYSLYDWWMSGGNELESHFYIRYDGTLEQYIDTSRSADANYLANLRPDGSGAISVETQGLADGTWTLQQLDTIQQLIDWAHEVHGVPLRVCNTPGDPGVGYHVMFGAPGAWTPARGKVCPGPNRIQQFIDVIVPRLRAPDVEEGLDMADVDEIYDQLKLVLAGLNLMYRGDLAPKGVAETADGGDTHPGNLVNIERRLAELERLLTELLEKHNDAGS